MITETDLGVLWEAYTATMGTKPRPVVWRDIRALWRLTLGEPLIGDVERVERLHRLLRTMSAADDQLCAVDAARGVVRAVWGEHHPILRSSVPVGSWSHQAPGLPAFGEWTVCSYPTRSGPGDEMRTRTSSRSLEEAADLHWRHLQVCSPADNQPQAGDVIAVRDWRGWWHGARWDGDGWRWVRLVRLAA